MVSFSFEPWKDNIRFELCSTSYCFELRDQEHRVHVFLREFDGKVSTTLTIDLQKNPGYEQYVKKMLELAAFDLRLEDHKKLYKLYEHLIHLFASGRHVDILFEWEEEGITARTAVTLQKGRIYVSVKADAGPHHIFYQAQTDVQDDIHEYVRWLKHFLSDVARLLWLLKEYSKNQTPQEKA